MTWIMGMFLKDSDELVSSCEAVHVYTDQTTMNQHQLQTILKKSYSLINQNVRTNIINMNQRRYDIDALRSIAMFLLIFYHLGISFTSIADKSLSFKTKG